MTGPDERTQQPGLALAPLAEEHDVVSRDDGPLELWDDGVLEAVQSRPRVAPVSQRGQQVVAHLGLEVLLLVSGRPQRAEGGDRRWLSHTFTLTRRVNPLSNNEAVCR